MGNSLCASAREDANGSVKGFAWFRQEPEVKSRPVFRETEAVKKAQEEREEREGGIRARRGTSRPWPTP